MELYELDASALLLALKKRETSSVEVVKELILRRNAVDGQIGAIIARFDAQALKEAAAADAARAAAKGSDELGPLHGLPLTIKDNIDVCGTDSTLGIPRRVGQPAKADSVIVKVLRQAGAIVLGKTNVSQLLLVQESDNQVFGVTRNPWDLSRTPGGSSGGEAAALASGQTPIGIGTDIGGSIRIPAHFTGVCGLKPTLDRLSNRGIHGAISGQELVRAQVGPMARSVRDLALVLGALDPVAQSALDPAVPPLSFSAPRSLKGLRIGYFVDDGFLTPAPGIVRAVREGVAALQAAGATVLDYQPPDATRLPFLWLSGISSDGGQTLIRNLAGAPICKQLKLPHLLSRLPDPVRKLAAALLEGRGEAYLATLLRSLGEKSVATFWQLSAERTALRAREFDAWNAAELDAVICPPHVLPALPLGSSGPLMLTLSYMFRYVMLNFPCGVVPVTRVRASETTFLPAYKDSLLGKQCSAVLRGSSGLPLGVQVVARPYHEEVALAVMAALEADAQRHADYPRTPINPAPR